MVTQTTSVVEVMEMKIHGKIQDISWRQNKHFQGETWGEPESGATGDPRVRTMEPLAVMEDTVLGWGREGTDLERSTTVQLQTCTI